MSTRRSTTRKSLDDDDDDDSGDDDDVYVDDIEDDPNHTITDYALDQQEVSIGVQQRESARKFLWDEDDGGNTDGISTSMRLSSGAGGGRGDFVLPLGFTDETHDIDIHSTSTGQRGSLHYAHSHGYGPKGKSQRVSVCGAAIMSLLYKVCGRNCRYLPAYVVLGIVVFGIVALVNKSDSKSQDSSPVKPSSGGGGKNIGVEVMNQGRFDKLFEILQEGGYIDDNALNDERSSHNRALHWISNQDPYQIETFDQYMVNRYLLAVMYFSTTGHPAFGDGAVPASEWRNKANWLTEMGYCAWYGVECVATTGSKTHFDDNGVIIKLKLPNNGLLGKLKPNFFKLTTLDTLDLSGNDLSGSIPSNVDDMADASVISLANNYISGTIPGSFGSMSNLRELDLSENQLESPLPKQLKDATSLRALSLYKNQFQEKLQDLPRLSENLEVLYLDHNKFHGLIPRTMYSYSRLTDLQLQGNNLEGELSDHLGKLGSLRKLDLTSNKLGGTLPDVFENLSMLNEFKITNNEFQGSVPESLGSLSLLRVLNMAENELTGSIPSAFESMTSLREIKLEMNQLDSSIPDVFDKFRHLEILKLESNQFSGPIPASLPSSLKEIMVQENRLTGTVPEGLGNFSNLIRFTLYENNIVGTMPSGICARVSPDELNFLAADCKDEENGPKIECDCCSQCF